MISSALLSRAIQGPKTSKQKNRMTKTDIPLQTKRKRNIYVNNLLDSLLEWLHHRPNMSDMLVPAQRSKILNLSKFYHQFCVSSLNLIKIKRNDFQLVGASILKI